MIGNDWEEILKREFISDYYIKLNEFLDAEYAQQNIFPPRDDVFTALKLTPFSSVKVVILGQDPYHGFGQAHGLAFSVKPGVAIPPSLRNIFKELNDDLGVPIPDNGCLLPWAREGVLLLNTALTVREGAADSHKGRGWETFTDAIIRRLNERTQPIVFILWGRNALAKEELISNTKNMILRAPHPSPLSASRGFFGCKHFSKTNTILRACGIAPIDWAIPNTGQMKEHP